MSLYGASRAPGVGRSPVVALTENSGAVGGTNDGNMPAVATVSATYVQAEVVAIRDAVRECAAKINALIAKLDER